MTDTHVLYHGNCNDGFGAAWAAHHHFGDGAEYHAMQHGAETPEVEPGSHYVVVDYCLKRPEMEKLLSEGYKITVLDHHKTAQADLEGLQHDNLTVVFDMDRSGSVITWQYFFPHLEVPKLLQWVQDVDIWKWELEGSDAATEALRTYPYEFDVWDVLDANPGSLLDNGEALLRLRDQKIKSTLERVYFDVVGGHKVPVVNSDSYISKLVNKMCLDYPDYPFAASWFEAGDGSRKWSLRSVGEFDVSEIAAQHGGGGHRNAAGFTEI